MVGEGVPTRPWGDNCFGVITFLCFTLSLGLLEAKIHVFPEGPSENERVKQKSSQILQFRIIPRSFFRNCIFRFPYIFKGSQGHMLTK